MRNELNCSPGIRARKLLLQVVATLPILVATGLPAPGQDLSRLFHDPPDSARMSVYWIWFGPAVTQEGISTDLENMRRAHIGGMCLLPMYPLSLDDPQKGIRNLPYLSSDFLNMLGYTAGRSREMGLALDVTVGTGWPYGGPWITPELGSQRLRIRSAAEPLKQGEHLVATVGTRAIVSMPTGMMVKRPSLGSEGLVLDHYSRAAIDRHLDVAGEQLWQAVKGKGIRLSGATVSRCSERTGRRNAAYFQKHRGYDLKTVLSLLFDQETEEGRQVRHDFWQTLSEMAVENFAKPLHEWCRRKGVPLAMEPYGVPPVSLNTFRYVDRPYGEHYDWRNFNASRWSSSGAHLFGKTS